MSSSSNVWKSVVEGSPLGRVHCGVADRGRRRTTVRREPRTVRRSLALWRLRLGDHALDPGSGPCQEFRRSVVEVGDDARIEYRTPLLRAHLLEFSGGPDLRSHDQSLLFAVGAVGPMSASTALSTCRRFVHLGRNASSDERQSARRSCGRSWSPGSYRPMSSQHRLVWGSSTGQRPRPRVRGCQACRTRSRSVLLGERRRLR